MTTRVCTDAHSYVQAHTKSLQLKSTCPSLFNRGRQHQLCIQLGVSLWSVFVSSVSHRLDPGATLSCSFPCLQLHNCIQRSSLQGDWGVTGFSSLGWGFLFPAAPPVVCFAPVLSSPTREAGDCLILVVETALQMPQDLPFYFAYLLPHTWHYCPFPAARSCYNCHSGADRLLSHQGHSSERQNSPSLCRDSARCPCSWLGPCA